MVIPMRETERVLYTPSQRFQPFSRRGTLKLITNILQHTKIHIFLLISQKNKYNFDSFIPDGSCVG